MAGRIAGERRTPDTSSREVSNDAADSGAAAGPGARRGRHVRGPALSAQANSALSMPDEEVVSNNISALCIRGDAGAAGTSAAADPNSADQPVCSCHLPAVHLLSKKEAAVLSFSSASVRLSPGEGNCPCNDLPRH